MSLFYQVNILLAVFLTISHGVLCVPLNVIKNILGRNPRITGGVISPLSRARCPGPFRSNQVLATIGEPYCEGTVTTDVLNVRSEPDTSSRIVGQLSEGLKLTFTDRVRGTSVRGNTGWLKTAHGYVSAYYINLLDPKPSWCYNSEK